MKKGLFYISLIILTGTLSCKKESFTYPKDTVAGSKVIYFPLIAIKGDQFVAVKEGEGYTDPGATATVNDADVEFTTSVKVDASSAPGVYVIDYAAQNPQGYSASDFRYVVVYPAAPADNDDFSGNYLRSNGQLLVLTKLAPFAYKVNNPGGAVGADNIVAVAIYDGTKLAIPEQESPYLGGKVVTDAEVFQVGPPSTIIWKFLANGYGTQPRTFVKQ